MSCRPYLRTFGRVCSNSASTREFAVKGSSKCRVAQSNEVRLSRDPVEPYDETANGHTHIECVVPDRRLVPNLSKHQHRAVAVALFRQDPQRGRLVADHGRWVLAVLPGGPRVDRPAGAQGQVGGIPLSCQPASCRAYPRRDPTTGAAHLRRVAAVRDRRSVFGYFCWR